MNMHLTAATQASGSAWRHWMCVLASADSLQRPAFCSAASLWVAPCIWLTALRALLTQSSVRKLARRTGYGEVFAVPDPAVAEAAVRARADAMADKLEARAQQEIGGLPFTSCADCPTAPATRGAPCDPCSTAT